MELSGYAFDRVCDVEPDRTDGGAIEIRVPQPEYDRRDEKAVHDDGWGPFCSFDVPDEGTHRPGVYVLVVGDDVVYVGETKDLYGQFVDGYGRISPANCFEGGQGTNCRLNTAIFRAVREGRPVSLHLHATDDFAGTEAENRALRRIIKDDLITALDPAWNKNAGGASETDETPTAEASAADAAPRTDQFAPRADDSPPRPDERPDGPASNRPEDAALNRPDDVASNRSDAPASNRPPDAPTGEFAELYDYLADHERDEVERTFAELEVVLDAPLPTEARRWQRWWTNDEASHPHAAAWLRAGYEVADVSLPDGRVRFERRADRTRDGDGSKSTPEEAPTPGDATAARTEVTDPFRRASPRRRE